MTTNGARSKTASVVMVASGNLLEAYDFVVFGYYAAAIGATFFPARSEFASLMLSLMTFGAGFLTRPLGAVVLGAYMDKHGRRAGLLVSLALMALGTTLIAVMPGYASIGMLAPIMIVCARLTQGFSQGAEAGGVSVYLSEIATPGRKGFYVAWQSATNQVAVIAAALLGLLLTANLSRAQMTAWGWRVPLLAGSVMIPFLFVVRRSLTETAAFLQRRHHPTMSDVVRGVAGNWRLVLLGTMVMTMTTVSFYLITTYTPTYGTATLKLTASRSMTVTLCVGIVNFALLPVMGALSDRIGRPPQMIACTALAALTAYPALVWLVASPSFARLLAVEVWLALLYAGYNGAMVAYLTEMMPAAVRTSGFSIAYSLGTAIMGGFTPAVCAYLIQATGNRAMPGVWLSCAALISLAGLLLVRTRSSSEVPSLP
jgi:MFS family permease